MDKKRGAYLVVVFIVVASAWAKPTPIGAISSCQAATIDGTNLIPGATIFSDDTIDVGPGGHAWIAAQGGTQVQVFENSTVKFSSKNNAIELSVNRGQAKTNSPSIVVRSVSSAQVQHSDGGRVSPAQGKEMGCEVSKSARRTKICHDATD